MLNVREHNWSSSSSEYISGGGNVFKKGEMVENIHELLIER